MVVLQVLSPRSGKSVLRGDGCVTRSTTCGVRCHWALWRCGEGRRGTSAVPGRCGWPRTGAPGVFLPVRPPQGNQLLHLPFCRVEGLCWFLGSGRRAFCPSLEVGEALLYASPGPPGGPLFVCSSQKGHCVLWEDSGHPQVSHLSLSVASGFLQV